MLLACLISAGHAASRYLFSECSNGWLEIQWYLFAGMVLLGAPYTLKLFLLPICLILIYYTWPWFVASWQGHEGSSNAGGLLRWPVKLLLPLGFALMALQGISEIIKRVAAIEQLIEDDFKYEKPLP